MSGGALSHIRVLDLTRVLAGPWATQTLADFGADVIKIEHPARGDDTRHWGPPYIKDADGAELEDAAYFCGTNRNKRSVGIDIAQPEGAGMVRRLAQKCDIVVENFKVGGLAKYGLDYATLKDGNPGLIYCSITGFGQTGPYTARAGYDFMIQGLSGLMSVTGQPDGAPGGGPMKIGVALSDVMAGLYATIGILAALTHRDRTGQGQYIDISLLDTSVAVLANQAMNFLTTGVAPRRLGNAHPNIVPYQAFATADGHLIVAVGNDKQFAKFCAAAGLDAIAGDQRFATNAGRVRHRDDLVPVIIEAMAAYSTQWWMESLEAAGVPFGPINTLDQVFADPQVQARELELQLRRPDGVPVPTVANPVRLSQTPPAYTIAPPTLGQHTGEVLAQLLGLSTEECAAHAKAGTITKI
ncbi:MAG: CaiB/BaiF CoA transferase family protein [Alphaproteobacteria bacterium]